MNPEDIRARVGDAFRALSAGEISDRSSLIISRFFALFPASFWAGKKVALYRSLKDELRLEALCLRLKDSGVALAYPRIVSEKESLMEFDFPPERLDVIVVPGRAFGRQGERIGRGAGFYDRFLPRAPQALRLALGLDFQLFPSLPQKPWDARMDRIITESGDVELGKRAK